MIKKAIKSLLWSALLMTLVLHASAQEDTSATKQVISIAKSLEIYVFPSKDQTKEQQEMDEFQCYKWAVETSGVDPLNYQEVQAEQVERGPDGAAVGGAARGAAAGTAIGAIAGDAGKGAAIGAAAGAIRGRRAGNYAKGKKQQENNKEAEKQNAQTREKFIKAFSACMEGKGYTVR